MEQKKKSKRKSKSAIKREELNQRKQEIKNKSIAVSIVTCQMLHPDSEPDATLKLRKKK